MDSGDRKSQTWIITQAGPSGPQMTESDILYVIALCGYEIPHPMRGCIKCQIFFLS